MPPPQPPQPKPLCNICEESCNVEVSAFFVKIKKLFFHFGWLGVSSTSNIRRMIYWSCAGCIPIVAAGPSVLDRITTADKKPDCDDSLIHEVTMLRNGIALMNKAEYHFLKAAKNCTSQESKRESIQLSQCDSN